MVQHPTNPDSPVAKDLGPPDSSEGQRKGTQGTAATEVEEPPPVATPQSPGSEGVGLGGWVYGH